MAPVTGQKRKTPSAPSDASNQARKRQKSRDARAIPTQHTDAALSKNGELNIGQFIKAREFEIAALQQSMQKARKSLSQRAFQQVPRHLRRRTASHNVKKIPRRLRPRATKEISEDNTPTGSARRRRPSAKLRLRLQTARRLQKLNTTRKTVRQKKREAKLNAKEPDPQNHVDIQRIPGLKKNQLAQPPQAVAKYKRRQVDKTWLPTHLWHTKRAHMTRPKMPLWRFAIPMKPTEKTFRPTHRASGSRGCVAWDTSYISTIGCQGTEATLEGLLKSLRFAGVSGPGNTSRKWRSGSRHCEGWVYERDGSKRCIAPVSILWQSKPTENTRVKPAEDEMVDIDSELANRDKQPSRQKKPQLDRRLLIRVHPSAFDQLWLEVLKVAKLQKPQVLVEDLRFEVGSVTIQGPGATEALVGVLRLADEDSTANQIWPGFAALNNPSILPLNAMLAFNTIDPRLNHPPPQLKFAKTDASDHKLSEMIVAWPFDNNFPSSSLFDHKTRYRISRTLPSQKAINKRRTTLLPGHQLEPSENDPRIPTILLAHRSQKAEVAYQGFWTVLLPWSCVDPIWRSLMYYPLTTGSTPRFGGLEQSLQVASEQTVPWFPGDFPGTEAGKAWERTQTEEQFDEWLRHPPSKRIAWDTLDLGPGKKGELGRGWARDWEYLFRDSQIRDVRDEQKEKNSDGRRARKSSSPQLLTKRQRKAAAERPENDEEQQKRRRNTSSSECEGDNIYDVLQNDIKYVHLTTSDASAMVNGWKQATLPAQAALFTNRIKYLSRGTPKPTARVYRLPREDSSNVNGRGTHHDNEGSAKASKAPALFSLSDSKSSKPPSDLRSRWLSLDPNPTSHTFNPNSSTDLPQHKGGQKHNRFGHPATARVYDPQVTRDVSRVRVFPPGETRREILDMLGPKPPPPTQDEINRLYIPQLVPKMTINRDGELVEEELWDKHVPCPGPEDLLGFVTSGGYNLAEGAGTAIASIWMQRLIEGWRAEDELLQNDGIGSSAQSGMDKEASASGTQKNKTRKELEEEKRQAAEKKKSLKQIDRQRHLCIVRNAGESVGRLALWELC